jgi:F0F1-type ATP synthase assembly protein I
MPSDGDEPALVAQLYQWYARASAVAFEMVIPPIIGIGLDRYLSTVALCTILGVLLGVALGFWQLLKIAKASEATHCDSHCNSQCDVPSDNKSRECISADRADSHAD